jgi:predicted N-formylglutamate amidohydrolase
LAKGGDDLPEPSSGLLAAGGVGPAIVENLHGSSALVLLGDHAGREIPAPLGALGVAPADRERHIAWDIGVADLGGILAKRLDASFIRQRYSRLVIDCNRAPGAPGSIVEISDGVAIPGNRALSPADRDARRREIFQPYQDRIAEALDARRAAGRPTLLFSLHSFTPAMDGFARPWRFGVLHRNDSALSKIALEALRARWGEAVGDNQPYAMDGIDYTIPFHADARGLDYLELEVRQDLIATAEGRTAVADALADLLGQAAEAALSAQGARANRSAR